MAASRRSVNAPILQLKVTLSGIRPPIWRRIQVPGDISLHRLHEIIQVVMGWENYHLYEFEFQGNHFGDPDPGWDSDVKDARRTRLSRVAQREKARFSYEYDFGDGWRHEILVEKVLPAEPGKRYPMCLTGKRACPPEDCGGIWGYAELLEIISDPEHEEYEERMEWLGEEFHPEAFDLEEVNKELGSIR